MNRIALFAAFALSATPSLAASPKNIIMVVSDGMGPAFTTAYRYYADDPTTPLVEDTVLDRNLVGMSSTFPHETSGLVTDSAASATALSTGVKTYNGAIAVDVDKKPLETVLQRARKNGLKTGIAVTSQIVHATPAAYVAHNESRRNYDAIADSYLDDRLSGKFVLDVMLGGGWNYFLREDRNLVKEFTDAGYQYVDSYDQLASTAKGKPLLGLFGEVGLPWALDDTNPERLSLLTKTAVKHLENDKGFFLLVEASQVDWAGHANDVASAMAEMRDLAATMVWLEDYVKENPDTLVVLTADHSTGGFTIGANGEYRWEPEWLRNVNGSLTSLAKSLDDAEDKITAVEEVFGFELEDNEAQALRDADEDDENDYYGLLKSIINTRTNTGWTTRGHTGVDVPVYAIGASSKEFEGHVDNTDIAKKLFKLLGE